MLGADSANLELFAQWEQPSKMSVREKKIFKQIKPERINIQQAFVKKNDKGASQDKGK